MILGNFFVNIIEKEIDPFPGEMQLYKRYWDDFDTAFNIDDTHDEHRTFL